MDIKRQYICVCILLNKTQKLNNTRRKEERTKDSPPIEIIRGGGWPNLHNKDNSQYNLKIIYSISIKTGGLLFSWNLTEESKRYNDG